MGKIDVIGNNVPQTATGGTPVAVIESVLASDGPEIIDEKAMTLADTEYSYTFPIGTKGFRLKNRENGLIKLSFVSGQSGTKYWTVWPGMEYRSANFNGLTSVTAYFQSPKSSQHLEVIYFS